jgi:ABC-type sugar transport system substrate-binding protein
MSQLCSVNGISSASASKACHLYVNHPDHAFDAGLKAEATRAAEQATAAGLPTTVQVRYARGDEKAQWQQLEDDCLAEKPPDLFVVIPINQDAVYRIVSKILNAREGVTCVFLHQPLSPMMRAERETFRTRLFSIAADQVEIGRMQARQLAAVLPGEKGDVLYVQGRANSYGTKQRMKGFLEELPRTPGVKLNGYRVYGDWSSESVKPAVESWMQMGGKLAWIGAAGAQNDDMALSLAELVKAQGVDIPVVGVDGLDKGKLAVDAGILAATVVQPLGVGHAIELFRDLLGGAPKRALIPDDGNIVLRPESYPPLERLASRPGQSSRSPS